MTRTARYLLALYVAEHRSAPPVSPGRVAESVDRSPAAATEMLQRLEADGLVDREPYHGVTLTDRGRERASDLHETYVALSWFFRDVLDLDAHEREAMEMAGLLSPDVADRLVTLLVDGDDRAANAHSDAPPPSPLRE
ncbi:metal-dependent transcriptional regulator [Halorubrum cibi]|uniref:Iron (Metal) dependent repressor, DtxR family n=1 Tax=Halorubrum cibi TaxID=413815 RepID=A0A521D695_9EURY|nr:metal-dependent transcriptional regulator [Halorubrum cibi]SMO67175.1 iron (metal) dependent repressor, DtxR family [Halorubrum cibi]